MQKCGIILIREKYAQINSDVNRRGMVEIKPEKVRKDNRNLYRMEGRGKELDRDLKKLRGKNPDYEEIEKLISYYAVLNYGAVCPFAEIDFQIDMERFAAGLSESNRRVFEMAMDNVSARVISEDLEMPLRTVYNKLIKLGELLKDYFSEE